MKKILLLIFALSTILFSGCLETCMKGGPYCSDSIYQKCTSIDQNKQLCGQTQYCAWCNNEYQSCDINMRGEIPTLENCKQKKGHCMTISDICSDK